MGQDMRHHQGKGIYSTWSILNIVVFSVSGGGAGPFCRTVGMENGASPTVDS